MIKTNFVFNAELGIGYQDHSDNNCYYYALGLSEKAGIDIPCNADTVYAKALLDVLRYGEQKGDRTGTGTISLFGYQMRLDISNSLPLLTTKKVHFHSIVGELLWFIGGCKGGIYGLKEEYGVSIWNEWQDQERKGKRVPYRNMVQWQGTAAYINQLQNVITEIKANPNSRRMVVLNWNPTDVALDKVVLPACHVLFQFYVDNNNALSCQVYIRSNDMFLGNPFNIASYALLTQMIARECSLKPNELIVAIGDAHIYNNHFQQVQTQLKRMPKPSPNIEFNPEIESIFDYQTEDIELINYYSHPAIKADVAV